jgi:polar amino acid transport system substrate-binding protein
MKPFLFAIFIVLFCAHQVVASSREAVVAEPLKIGIAFAPPFTITSDSELTGVCIDLWEQIADSLNIPYEYTRYNDYLSLMSALENKDIDLTINPITLTDYRLIYYKLSLPFYTSRMGMVERVGDVYPLIEAIKHLVRWPTLRLILMLVVVVILFALLIWLSERKSNPDQFRTGFKGFTDGIWWAFVTMTTVGYGDKVPMSKTGRILTIVWMFYAIALFFLVTAEISSELTVNKLQSDVSSIEDLRKSKVGTLDQTGYASLCIKNDISYVPFTDIKPGIEAVLHKKINVFVYDAAVLEYSIEKMSLENKLLVTSSDITTQYFCFAANKPYTDLMDQVNVVLFNIMESPSWLTILQQYNIER